MKHTIENQQLRISVKEEGAELTSLVRKENNCEVLWQGDPAYWEGQSPVLFPTIGEIIGGSVREESLDKLMAEINRREMETDKLWWYLDTRKWGTCPHAGFGLGFERCVMYLTGMSNIRDVLPYPRTVKNCEL